MGLLDNMDDPQKQFLLAMGLGLLGGAPNSRKNFGADIANAGLMGMGAYGQAMSAKDRREQEKQQREYRQMEMDRMRQAQAREDALRQAATDAFRPPQEAAGPMPDGVSPLMLPGGGGMPQLAQDAMRIDPLGLGMKLAPKPGQRNIKDVAPGATLFDVDNNRPLFQAPQKTPDWMNPDYQRFMMDKARAGATRVNVDGRQETEFAKAVGKQSGEDYSNLMKSDAMASSKLNKLGRLEALLNSSGNTGRLTPATMELKSVAESLGFKVDHRLPFQQAAQALSNEIALELRNPAGGAGMPGALSDKDREFLVNMVPNLAKTPEGNKILIESMKKLAQREKEVAKLAREYRKQTGRFDEGFYDVLARFSAANPLFDSAPQSGLTPAEQTELEQLRKRFGAR